MYIYRITNRVNGKVYIGKCERLSHTRRWQEHQRDALNQSPLHFHRAIRKYGAAAFTIEIIYQAKTRHELLKMETFFIILHQSHIRDNGYNMTIGGEGVFPPAWLGKKRPPFSLEHRKKTSLTMTGRKRSSQHCENIRQSKLGKPLSEAHRQAISVSNQKYYSENYDQCHAMLSTRVRLMREAGHDPRKGTGKGPGTGVKHTPEAKAKMGKMNRVRVRCIDTNETFLSLTIAAKQFGGSVKGLSRSIKKGHKFSGKRFEYA
jgi:group I intron endonuclease